MRYGIRTNYGRNGKPTGVEVHATALAPSEARRGDDVYATGEVSLSRSREEPNFDNREWMRADRYGVSEDYSEIHDDGNGNYAEPNELFTHISPQIRGAYVDHRLRHSVPTMIGLAMHHLGSQADVPMADSNLTQFSSALSRNAVSRGLAVPHYLNPEMRSGDAEWDDDAEDYVEPPATTPPARLTYSSSPPGTEATPQQVADARSWVKDRLRPAKAMRGESQFTGDIPSESHQDWANSGIKPGPGQESLF
jgi:hypothetical protein